MTFSHLYYGRDMHQPCAEYGGHSKSGRGGGEMIPVFLDALVLVMRKGFS